MSLIGLELTFLPRNPGSKWKEFLTLKAAEEAAIALNARK